MTLLKISLLVSTGTAGLPGTDTVLTAVADLPSLEIVNVNSTSVSISGFVIFPSKEIISG